MGFLHIPRQCLAAMAVCALALLCAMPSGSAAQQSPATLPVVVDSLTGIPLARVTVHDRNGHTIAVTSDRGVMPSIDAASYPLTLSSMGYRPVVVPAPGRQIINMSETSYNLPEVVVNPGKREALRIKAYVREYASLSTYSDTVLLFREKMVDFMVPSKKTKGYKGWLKPRVLDSRSFYHFSDANGLDSVSNSYRQHFSWADWVGIVDHTVIPDAFRDAEVMADSIAGASGPAAFWSKADDIFHINVDILADSVNRRWVPSFASYLASNVDFTRFDVNYTFTDVGVSEILASNLARMSFHIESYGRGRSMFRVFDKNTPYYIKTYAEVYVVDREHLSLNEAKRLERRPDEAGELAIVAPSDAPPLDPAIASLISRVGQIDHAGRRLALTPDKRVAGRMEIFDKKPENAAWKYIKSLIGL